MTDTEAQMNRGAIEKIEKEFPPATAREIYGEMNIQLQPAVFDFLVEVLGGMVIRWAIRKALGQIVRDENWDYFTRCQQRDAR